MTQLNINGTKFKIIIEWFKPVGSTKEVVKQYEFMTISEMIDFKQICLDPNFQVKNPEVCF